RHHRWQPAPSAHLRMTALVRLAVEIRAGGIAAARAAAHDARARAQSVSGAVAHPADDALIEARLAAINWSAPFAGVPTLIKDTAPEAGCHFTYGSRTLDGYVASTTGPMPAALARLGFVSVG